jgi:predicted enzyme related to lactoylglutathione lyase
VAIGGETGRAIPLKRDLRARDEFYVGVPDVGAALDKAESLGGTRVFGPEEVMQRLILGQFKDPEGHLIGLVSGTT